MKKILSMRLKVKMIFLFLAITFLPIIGFSLLILKLTTNALIEAKTQELVLTRTRKGGQILEHLDKLAEDMNFVTTTREFKEAVGDLTAYHQHGGQGQGSAFNTGSEAYQRIMEEIDPFFSGILDTWHYYDVLLVCAEHGHVMYSVLGEEDRGSNLSTGPYRNSGMAEAWGKVVSSGKICMVDFSFYEPSKKQSAFIGFPVFDQDREITAVLMMQEVVETMHNILNPEILGVEQGEVYIVGEDLKARSVLAADSDAGRSPGRIETHAVQEALNGQAGAGILKNYEGRKVLSAYAPVGLKEIDSLTADFDWAIIAEEDLGELLLQVNRLRSRILLISLAIMLLVILLAILFANDLARPIVRIARIARRIGEGDLSTAVERSPRNDEIGILRNALALMRDKLKTQVEEVTEGVNILTASTSEISTTLKQFTSSSQETVSSVTETTATVEEVRQTIQVAMDRASEIMESTQKTIEVSSEGKKSVAEALQGIQDIDKQMKRIAESILALSQQTQAIGDIVSTIKDLAEQSNLLAVNAAIEAAKAGEEGGGFSVVASEVKNLAEQSKEATNRVREILNEVQKATSDTVMATEQGTKTVQDGLIRVNSTGESINTLAAIIDEASQATMQIGASTKQQFIGIDQVNEAMQNINTAGTQNLESARQLEAASGRLIELGQLLQKQLEIYKFD